ncbi:unnamed protein product [Rotaria sordida]|uniref:Uncharacterized protein n=1 Tax=Rotaria sordida TaxID=392033 RepID=A0A815U3S5_9BILA|nr:unnamed protein product [Rotaria sordida]CAF1276119.1 unnamed protein product [Rotaria sordida]CAF1510628.1 unnamed protein product [Rotaria sordida]
MMENDYEAQTTPNIYSSNTFHDSSLNKDKSFLQENKQSNINLSRKIIVFELFNCAISFILFRLVYSRCCLGVSGQTNGSVL